MDPLYYDVNFLKSGNFSFENIKTLFGYLCKITDNIDIEASIIIKAEYSDLSFSFLEKTDYQIESIILNAKNYESILTNNIITDLYIQLTGFCKLHVHIGYYGHEQKTNLAKIGFYYTIDNVSSINFNDIFFYIGDNVFKAIAVLNPDTVNMGETTTPASLGDIKNGDFGREYLFINNKFINDLIFNKYLDQLNFQKLSNGYIFTIKGCEDIIPKIIL